MCIKLPLTAFTACMHADQPVLKEWTPQSQTVRDAYYLMRSWHGILTRACATLVYALILAIFTQEAVRLQACIGCAGRRFG
jgi:hypothetical protein